MHDRPAASTSSTESWIAPPAELSAGGTTPDRRDLISLGLLLGVVLTVLAVNFWSRYNLYRLDIVTFYIPWYEQLGHRLRDFDIPGWMPYAMSGSPFAGDPQSGWGYLPAMVIFTIAPTLGGYIAFIVFHVVLAAAGTYAYSRVIGMNPVGAFAAGAAGASAESSAAMTRAVSAARVSGLANTWSKRSGMPARRAATRRACATPNGLRLGPRRASAEGSGA